MLISVNEKMFDKLKYPFMINIKWNIEDEVWNLSSNSSEIKTMGGEGGRKETEWMIDKATWRRVKCWWIWVREFFVLFLPFYLGLKLFQNKVFKKALGKMLKIPLFKNQDYPWVGNCWSWMVSTWHLLYYFYYFYMHLKC